jgi:hypothetical protein
MVTNPRFKMITLELMIAVLVGGCAGRILPRQVSTPTVETTLTQPRIPEISITRTSPQITVTQRETMPTASPIPENQAENPLVRKAKVDLAHRLNVPIEDIELMQYEEVFWRDTSLGCPQPGMVYAQVITPGFRITLKAKGQIYDYHTDTSRYVFLCETKETPIEPIPLMPVAPHDKLPKCKRTPCP